MQSSKKKAVSLSRLYFYYSSSNQPHTVPVISVGLLFHNIWSAPAPFGTKQAPLSVSGI